MTLYRIVFETEILIVAPDEQEAIRDAEKYVEEETHNLLSSGVVEDVKELGEWAGALPYTSQSVDNPHEKTCEHFIEPVV